MRLSSSAELSIRILDLNDNPPELRNGGTVFIPADLQRGWSNSYSFHIHNNLLSCKIEFKVYNGGHKIFFAQK